MWINEAWVAQAYERCEAAISIANDPPDRLVFGSWEPLPTHRLPGCSRHLGLNDEALDRDRVMSGFEGSVQAADVLSLACPASVSGLAEAAGTSGGEIGSSGRSRSANCSAATGLLNRKPCISSQR